MDEILDRWNTFKKSLERNDRKLLAYPKEGEVWVSIIGRNIGYEQNGSQKDFSRPVLIVKKFNHRMAWCVPLSRKQKHFDFYYNFTSPEGEAVSAILAQMRILSAKRLVRKMYALPDEHALLIKEKLRDLLIPIEIPQ